MILVEVHNPNATRRRSTGVLSLKTAAISSSTISGSLLSVRMGVGPIFAQALKAVNPLSRGLNGRKEVERAHLFCYNPAVFEARKRAQRFSPVGL